MKGTIVRFYRNRGFGFIKPAAGGKQVLVHWSNLVTDDKWPFVQRGTKVEFKLDEKDDAKRSAKEVTLEGGEKIPIFTPDNSDRVSNDDDIYSGTVKFYDYRKGFGVILPEEEITWNDVTAKDGVLFSRDAIISAGAAKGMVLNLRSGTKVTFKVHADKRGLGAHELQNEDGNPIEYEARKARKGGKKRKRSSKKVAKRKSAKKSKKNKKKGGDKIIKKTKEELQEEREVDMEDTVYAGTVKTYRTEKGFGFISIEDDITFNGATAKEKIYFMKEDIVCYSDTVGLNPDTKVIFKLYKDSLGLGACEIQNEDGTPIIFEPANESAESMPEEVQKQVPKKVPAGTKNKKKTTKKKATKKKTTKKKATKKKTKKRTTKN